MTDNRGGGISNTHTHTHLANPRDSPALDLYSRRMPSRSYLLYQSRPALLPNPLGVASFQRCTTSIMGPSPRRRGAVGEKDGLPKGGNWTHPVAQEIPS